MTSDNTAQPTQILVEPVKVEITLDDVFETLAKVASSLAAGCGGVPPQPELMGHMQRISQLACEIKDEINTLKKLDPAMITQLHRGADEVPLSGLG